MIDYNSSSNMYIFPTDGYLCVNAGSVDKEVEVHIYGTTMGTGNSYFSVCSEYVSGGSIGQLQAVFVRKGMRVYCQGTFTFSSSVKFYSLV